MHASCTAVRVSIGCFVVAWLSGCSPGFEVASNLSQTDAASLSFTASRCSTSSTLDRSPLRLVSNFEYDNIVGDVFQIQKKISLEAKFDVLSPGVSGFSNTSVTSEANSPQITDLMVEKHFLAAGLVADEVIANKAKPGSAFSQFAACAANSNAPSASCLDSIVRKLGLRTWRRPLTEDEAGRLRALLAGGTSFDAGFRDLIRALLASPNFFAVSFHLKANPSTPQSFVLSDYQMASRLSFFLWQSVPDEELLNLAAAGALSKSISEQIDRMLKDPKAKRIASVLTEEWLELNRIQNAGLEIDAATLSSMLAESRYLFEDIISSDTSFLNAVSADYSFLNKTLADYYGVQFVGGDPSSFIKTSLASTPRRGILNQAAFLIATAGSPAETHPVLRGKTVVNKIACVEIPPPPADVDTSLPTTLPENSTPKELMAVHTSNTQCAACHKAIDPHGLPLETFDSFGKWRTTYAELGGRTIDQSGQFANGRSFNTTSEFMSELASSQDVRTCLVRQVMSLGIARGAGSRDDRCVSSEVGETTVNPGSSFSDMIKAIAMSRQFRTQTTEAP